MATLPQEFIDLAAELIGDEFAAFANDAVFVRAGAFDPDTQTSTTDTQTVPMIPIEWSEDSFNGQLVKTGDYFFVSEYALYNWIPSPDNTTVTHDGVVMNIVSVQNYGKAVAIMHARRA